MTGSTPIEEHLAGRRRAAELMAALELLEQVPVEELDAVVRVAAAVTGVSNGTVNLLDQTLQHQLSCSGFDGGSPPSRSADRPARCGLDGTGHEATPRPGRRDLA